MHQRIAVPISYPTSHMPILIFQELSINRSLPQLATPSTTASSIPSSRCAKKVILQPLRRLPHLLRRLVPASIPPSTATSTPTACPSVPPPTATSAAPFSTPLLCKAAPIVLRRRVVPPSHCIRPDLTSRHNPYNQPNNIS